MTTTTAISEDHIPTQADFDRFARISGDDNPIHVDPVFASRTRFGRTVAHGMFLSSVLWGLVRRHQPRAGRQLSQNVKFPNPAFSDEPLRFAATVADSSGSIAVTFTIVRVADGAVVCEGDAAFEIAGRQS